MKAFVVAVLASLTALAVAALALAIVWPNLRTRVVADLKDEVRSQGVAKEAAGDALRGLVDAAKSLRP